MFFSSNIKFLRKRRGRTQDDVAFALRMKRSTLSGYENEVSQPTLQALIAFSKYYGYATGFADPEYISELPVFQLPFLSKQKKYRTFQLTGDSMLPITPKSWVTG